MTGLRPGAVVVLYDGAGGEIGVGESPGESFDFDLPSALAPNAKVRAAQRVCNVESDRSEVVEAAPAAASLSPAWIRGPLFPCRHHVRVDNLHPGAIVTLRERSRGLVRSDALLVADPIAWVPVRPGLHEGEVIVAVQVGCGTEVTSPPETVGALPPVEPPTLAAPIVDGYRYVTVRGLVPGTLVDVSVDGVWLTTADAVTEALDVILPGVLRTGQEVAARQRICDVITEYGPAVQVRATPPVVSSVSPLRVGRRDVPYHVQLTATGGVGDYSWRTNSRLPAGLTLSVRGELSGTPTAVETVSFEAAVTDSGIPPMTGTRALSVGIVGPPVVTSPSPLPRGQVMVPYGLQLTATGGVPDFTGVRDYFWSADGRLPAGLALSAAGSLSGRSSLVETTTFDVIVNDSGPSPGDQSRSTFSLSVEPAPQPDARVEFTFHLGGDWRVWITPAWVEMLVLPPGRDPAQPIKQRMTASLAGTYFARVGAHEGSAGVWYFQCALRGTDTLGNDTGEIRSPVWSHPWLWRSPAAYFRYESFDDMGRPAWILDSIPNS